MQLIKYRIRSVAPDTLDLMGERQKSAKVILWENVRRLMKARYGSENLNRLSRETKLGIATVQRIKAAETSVGIDVIEKIARWAKREPYELLCANALDVEISVLIRAYNASDDRGREFLVATAETALRKRDAKPAKQQTGTEG